MAIMDRSMEGKRQYTTGISKGVFFGEDGKAFPWNGLISVTEKPQANAPTPVYNSLGEKYDQFGNIAEKKHSLTCYTYPEEMDEFLGIEYLEEMGYSVDERPPKKFSMAYRTELGDGLYEIHVLLNQIATFADTAKNTITNNITPTVVTMNLEGVPDPRIKTSHIILDSRLPLTESAERLLFGDRLIDGNINEFLDAEPTWVTVATNYAPIIEPDYDNMVWLGGVNLALDCTDIPNGITIPSSYINKIWVDDYYLLMAKSSFLEGDVVTVTIKGLLPEGRSTFMLYMATTTNVYVGLTRNVKDDLWSLTFTVSEAQANGTGLRIYSGTSANSAEDSPGQTYIEWIKIERGSVATPWTPAPEDNYVPPSDQPRPANYKPGVKYGHVWDHRNQSSREVIAFYDEHTGGVGVYSYAENDTGIRGLGLTPYRRDLHQGLTVKFESEVIIHEPMSVDNSLLGRIRIQPSHTHTSERIPNVRGTYNVTAEKPNYTTDLGSVGRVFAYRGGFVGEPYITYRNWLATTSDYTGEFFDVHTTPKTRGDRYQRVVSPYGDYTEHQQLMLQSKSRVILSDITPNQYTLEASDSQLRVDGQTFTFKGPQATPVGDDQFTINDEIYGED